MKHLTKFTTLYPRQGGPEARCYGLFDTAEAAQAALDASDNVDAAYAVVVPIDMPVEEDDGPREVMVSHEGHAACVCTDGRAAERDVMETCDFPLPPRPAQVRRQDWRAVRPGIDFGRTS